MKKSLLLLLLIPLLNLSDMAQQAKVHPKNVDPEWLHRFVSHSSFQACWTSTTPTCHYKPMFGVGDPEALPADAPIDFNLTPVTIARYGELTVDPKGECKTVSYPREEQIYVILKGEGTLHYGDDTSPIRKDDFMYLPPTVAHTVTNSSAQPLHLVVMGFKIPENIQIEAPAKLKIANLANVEEKVAGGMALLFNTS